MLRLAAADATGRQALQDFAQVGRRISLAPAGLLSEATAGGHAGNGGKCKCTCLPRGRPSGRARPCLAHPSAPPWPPASLPSAVPALQEPRRRCRAARDAAGAARPPPAAHPLLGAPFQGGLCAAGRPLGGRRRGHAGTGGAPGAALSADALVHPSVRRPCCPARLAAPSQNLTLRVLPARCPPPMAHSISLPLVAPPPPPSAIPPRDAPGARLPASTAPTTLH